MFRLDGKTALVTGATGGIGEAIARDFNSAGAKVILTGRREEVLKKLAEDMGGETKYVVADLAKREELEGLYTKAEELGGGKVDILVCNAGITKDNLALRMKDDEWDEVISTNLSSVFTLNKLAFKKMMRNKWGRVINITSVVAVTGNPGQANYAAAKAGMVGMTKSLAAESATRGITYNAIAPGFIKTAMTDALNEDQVARIVNNIPSGRFGLPKDIAAAALFLASDEAGYITGQTIHVNGGMLMV